MKDTQQITKAAVMAAGLGTRLRPYTDHLPKPLVKFQDKPMLTSVLSRLERIGIKNAAINIHYHADKLKQWLDQNQDNYHVPLDISDETLGLLNTGGGVKKMQILLGREAILVCNSDTQFADENHANYLKNMINSFDPRIMDFLFLVCQKEHMLGYPGKGDFCISKTHQKESRNIGSSSVLYPLEMHQSNVTQQCNIAYNYVNTGMYIVHAQYCKITPSGAFSIVDYWKESAKRNRLWGYMYDGIIYDLGTMEGLTLCRAHAKNT